MIKLFNLIVLAIIAFFLQSCIVSSKTSKFDFAKDVDFGKEANVMTINVPTFIAKSYLKKSLRKSGESQELINLVKKVSDVKVLLVENSKSSLKEDFQSFVNKNNFQEWVSVKQNNQVVSILANQSSNDTINRLIINVNNDNKDIVFVDVKGKFTADDISNLINVSNSNQLNIKFN